MSDEMLLESLGWPVDRKEQITSRRERETYRYCETGKGRYAFKVTVDDGMVTGWDGMPQEAAWRATSLRDFMEREEVKPTIWGAKIVFALAAVSTIGIATARAVYVPTYNGPPWARKAVDAAAFAATLAPTPPKAVAAPPAKPRAPVRRAPTAAPTASAAPSVDPANPYAEPPASAAPSAPAAPLGVKAE